MEKSNCCCLRWLAAPSAYEASIQVKIHKLLFICTGNSACSILAEALMNPLGGGRFRAYSAGSQPTGRVNLLALQTLKGLHLPTDGLRSKSWDEFAQSDAANLDSVFTVCSKASGEVCPLWPGQPVTAHWGVEDPAAADGSETAKLRAFMTRAVILKRRTDLMLALPLERLGTLSLHHQLQDIGKA